ncbi:Hypothetical protein, putative [Bodo saltans]|uniref:Glycosyltransferase 61 catalytic domain-containing protein n=1 Tax=Bodo saltans TaxID=75058 RepID=A0A0S4JNJ5_BODSA|nr:Hypothetical protein, putative [Bodo saltans]|eukprot:CUG93080.1 Hypothetical protein, putative [Bodo saltans]
MVTRFRLAVLLIASLLMTAAAYSLRQLRILDREDEGQIPWSASNQVVLTAEVGGQVPPEVNKERTNSLFVSGSSPHSIRRPSSRRGRTFLGNELQTPPFSYLSDSTLSAEELWKRQRMCARPDSLFSLQRGKGPKRAVNLVTPHDCVTGIRGATIDAKEGVTLHIHRDMPFGDHMSSVRFCSIAATSASQLPLLLRDAPKVATSDHNMHAADVPNTCGGEAVSITILERPQHAMQFLFSLFGAVAMQSSFGFDPNTDVAVISIVSYGQFATWEDLWRWDKYPHMELLQLLSKRGVAVVGQRHALKDLEVVTGSGTGDALLRGTPSSRSVVHLTGPWIKWNVSGQGPPPLPCSAKTALFGGLPARMLHYKKREAHRHAIHPWHFTMFRWRALEHFGIAEVLDPRERYAIVVARLKQKRRLILNHDTLVKTVASVGVGYRPVVVDWEGMKLEDQLRLALNANAIIGVHGNGHVWDCLMPSGGLMIEFSSDIGTRNEVGSGYNRRNVGNLAGLCPIESYSFRVRGIENAHSKGAPSSHVWKEVDLEVSEQQLQKLAEILLEHQESHVYDRSEKEGFTTHVTPPVDAGNGLRELKQRPPRRRS